MGLEIFGHGVAGEILVEDQRSDGSVILLQCAPYGKTSPARPSGVTVASSEGGSWPMLQEAGVATRRRGSCTSTPRRCLAGCCLSTSASSLKRRRGRLTRAFAL
jgi:hypothetical protein